MTLHDAKGIPIHPGDLLRSFHFRGARRKVYYLYHVVTRREDGSLWAVPTSELEPTLRNRGGTYRLTQESLLRDTIIISGYGPGDIVHFLDRPRVKSEVPQP